MYHSNDPVADYASYAADQERWLESRPICAWCEEHIQDECYFEIDGECICPECINAHKRWTEDYEG